MRFFINKFSYLALLFSFFCYGDFNAHYCITLLQEIITNPLFHKYQYSKLSQEQIDFLENHFLPAVGQRGIAKPSAETGLGYAPRDIVVGPDFIRIKGRNENEDFKIIWVNNLKQPDPTPDNGINTLKIPKNFDFSKSKETPEGYIRRALVGNPLHPFIKSTVAAKERLGLNEPEFILKEGQKQASQAVKQALERGDESFLLVADTGFGKTEILKTAIFEQMKKIHSQKLPPVMILSAHDTGLINQLEKDFKNSTTIPFKIIRKGVDIDRLTIEELENISKNATEPILLVTTTQAIVRGLKETTTEAEKDALYDRYRNVISFQVIDEAHHAGAPKTVGFLKELTDRKKGSKAFLFGPTATPTREDMEFVPTIFKNHDFWVNLDTADSYADRIEANQTSGRDISHVIEQLYLSRMRGEAHPFKTRFLNPHKFETGGQELFIKSENRFVVNPVYFPLLAEMTLQKYQMDKRGFITFNTRKEAYAFEQALKDLIEKKKLTDPNGQYPKFKVLVSDNEKLTKEQKDAIRGEFSSGKLDLLITVRMMDEGHNIPDLKFCLDFTHKTHPRKLLQRIGRLVRLDVGKKNPVEYITFQDITSEETARILHELDGIGRSRKLSSIRKDLEEEGEETTTETQLQDPLNPQDPFANVYWNPLELLGKRREFFTQDYARGEERGLNQAIEFHEYYKNHKENPEKYPLDPFQFAPDLKPRELRRQIRVYNILVQKINVRGSTKGPYFDVLKNEIQNFDHLKDNLQKQRLALFEQIETPSGAAKALLDFYKKYKRVPREKYATDDEIKLLNRFIELNTNPEFLATLYANKFEGSEALGITNYEPTLSAEHFPKTLEIFFAAHNRLPSLEATGFEKALANSMKNIFSDTEKTKPEIMYSNNDNLAIHLMVYQDPYRPKIVEKLSDSGNHTVTVKVPTEAPKTEIRSLPVFTQPKVLQGIAAELKKSNDKKAQTIEQQLQEYEGAKKKLERSKSKEEQFIALHELEAAAKKIATPDNFLFLLGQPIPKNPNKIVLDISAGSSSATGAERLVNYYIRTAKNRGLSAQVKSKGNNQYELAISGSQAYYHFLNEPGEVSVVYTEGSSRYTNPVKVSITSEDKPATEKINRKFEFDSNKQLQLLRDDRIDSKIQVSRQMTEVSVLEKRNSELLQKKLLNKFANASRN